MAQATFLCCLELHEGTINLQAHSKETLAKPHSIAKDTASDDQTRSMQDKIGWALTPVVFVNLRNLSLRLLSLALF